MYEEGPGIEVNLQVTLKPKAEALFPNEPVMAWCRYSTSSEAGSGSRAEPGRMRNVTPRQPSVIWGPSMYDIMSFQLA